MNTNNIFKQLIFMVAAVLISVQSAWAMDLSSAKAAGLIGEQPNGYLGLVVANAPDKVKVLIANVNAKRKAKYAEVAKGQGVKVADVERVAGEKTIKKTVSGNYILVQGRWLKKP